MSNIIHVLAKYLQVPLFVVEYSKIDLNFFHAIDHFN